jgi:NAD-dependent SIR2 family protein deacetylase
MSNDITDNGRRTDHYKLLDAGVLAQKLSTPEAGDCPYTLFLGAGASASSGIPTAAAMIHEWKRQLFRNERDLHSAPCSGTAAAHESEFQAWLEDHYPSWRKKYTERDDQEYAALFGHFFQHPKERQMYIERVVENGRPTFGYLYLAGLIHARRFNRVLTTNFDDLLNDALTRYYDTKPIVCAFDSAVAGIRIASKRPKIIKLHGDFLYDNIKNVRHELKALDSNMEEKLYDVCKDAGLIVVGYNGDDDSVMAPIRDMLRKPNYLNLGLHWCVYAPKGEPQRIPEEVDRLLTNHRDRVHLYSIESFDRLMEELFLRCDCELPPILVNPGQHNPPAQFFDALGGCSSDEPSDRMVDHLKRIVEQAGTTDETPERYVREAELFWNQGKVARKAAERARQRGDTGACASNYAKARRLFDTGLQRLAHPLGDSDDITNWARMSSSGIARATRRRAGLLIAIAKLLRDDPDASGDHQAMREVLERALSASHQGIAFVEGPNAGGLEPSLHRSQYFNGCCALGVLFGIDGRLSDERLTLARQWFAALCALDPDGLHKTKLRTDEDFAGLHEHLSGADSEPLPAEEDA